VQRELLRYLELAAVVTLLLVIGIVKFSRVTDEEKRQIVLEARLEQVYQFQKNHHAKTGSYFHPRSRAFISYFGWIEEYDCELRSRRDEFSAVVRADLDGDGDIGVWRIDHTSPDVQSVTED
jgi:hypothetical protein